MKNNKKIALIFICTIILTGCFNKDEKVSIDTDKSTANNIEVPVNKVYEDIADKKEWLKNATSEDLDKIIQEEIKMLNTPSSKYPFFEQLSNKKWNIQEIKKAWWMEITKWQIYLLWVDSKYTFINDILTENEKLFSFHQENSENNFFFVDSSADVFVKKIQSKYLDYKEISNQKEFIEIGFKDKWVNYSMQIMLPTQSNRDDIDNIFDTTNKVKVIINKL